MGQAPKGDTYNQDGDGLPLIAGAGDFGELHPAPTKFTTATNVRRSEAGDIVLSIRASIGSKVLADGEYGLGRGVAGLRVGPKVTSRYLWHWTTAAAPALAAKGRGATFLQVNKQDIAEMQVPLPPIEEQRRIAAVLDAADELRAKRREALAKIDTLTQAIFIDMFGDPTSNPMAWPEVPLGELLDGIDSGKSPTCHDRPADAGEWGVLKAGAVSFGVYDPDENKALPESVMPEPRHEVKTGDILFSRKNTHDLVAMTAFVHSTPARLLMSDLIFKLVIADPDAVDGRFLQAQLSVPRKRRELQTLAAGTSGSMPNISKAKVRTVSVALPPPELQRRFATGARNVEVAEATSLRSRERLDDLFASLQQRAFRGEL